MNGRTTTGTGQDIWTLRCGERPGGGPGRPTEDHIVVLPEAVAVLDGVSTVTDEAPLGGWYARTLGGVLAEHLTRHPSLPLPVLLAASIAAVSTGHGLRPGHGPAATVAVVRRTGELLEAAVLGDSPVVALGRDGSVHHLSDDRLATLLDPRPQTAEYRARLAAGSGFDRRHHELMRELRAYQHTVLNRPGGYWVAEATPEAGLHARTAAWPLAGLTDVLLLTDGVSSAVTDHHLLDWPALAATSRRTHPQQVVDTLHDTEAADPDAIAWPRAKPHDDKALAHLLLDLVDG
ncbi:PP2C family serine/threonine-protein phosphatase [Kitasatospora sp. NPDC096147]|uniref:PP2C family serine/threonine-protein phosphatase n=1 Tax=Kitasatospora sp. NPDC096147 TaxID=3364093 RepID=UPI00382F3890